MARKSYKAPRHRPVKVEITPAEAYLILGAIKSKKDLITRAAKAEGWRASEAAMTLADYVPIEEKLAPIASTTEQ